MKKLLFTLLLAAVTLPGWAETDLYLVGRATPIGWKKGGRSATKMIKTETNVYVWSGLLEKNTTDDDGFKICKGDDTWGAYTATSKGQDITSGTEEYGIQESDVDYKWDITETGYYTVTINLSTRKLKVTKNYTASFGIHRGNDPYPIDYLEIGSADALSDFAYLVNNGTNSTSFNANLTADITLNGSHTPIGTSSKKYSGTFDGKEHKIINLSITENGNSKGFFGETSGATIKDVEFLKANINITSGQNTGVVVGVCDNTTIQRCAVVNSIIKAHDHAGSIAGKGMGGSTITKCYSNATIQSDYQAGGMVGTSNGMTIDHCLFMGASIKTTNDTAGGLIARLEAGSTTLQYNFIASQHIFSQNGTRESECKTLARESNGTLDKKQHNYSLKATRYGNPTSNDVYNYSTHDDKNGAQKQPSEINETFFSSTLGFDFTNDWKMVSGLTYAGGSFPILKWMTAPTSSVEISSKEELYDFSAFMWDNQNVTLGSDITTDADYTPMGNEVLRYKGTFDGDGHSVTLAISKSGVPYQGLFGGAAGGAHFKNLIIKGSLTGGSSSAALVGEVGGEGYGGTITINRVGCEATVSGAYSYHGAFVGNNWGGTVKLEVEDCYNIGDVTGSSNTCVMGGYANNNSTFKNVFNKGTITGGGQYFVYHNLGKFDNCYTTSAETAEITGLTDEISSAMISSGELCYKLGHGTTSAEIWKQTIGTDNYPKLYGSTGVVNEVVADESYTNFATTDINSATHAVKIGTPDQLVKFSKEVNAGNVSMNAELTGNIDYSASAYQGQDAMIGTGPNPYKGTFDGQNHTITVGFNNTNAEYTGLFCQVNGATIKNLKVAGNITTDKKFAGGICANVNRKATITNCESNVTITDNRDTDVDGTHGGIVALISSHGGGVEISNCLFSGAITASKADGCGGVVGWTSGGSSNVTIKNCLITGTMTVRTTGANDIIARNGANESNNYYVGSFSGISNAEKATSATDTQKTFGELCYLLNGSMQGGTNWTQTIGTDNYPVPFNTQKLVYFNDPDYANMHIVNNVYQIATANELVDFSALVNSGSTSINAELTADIDMTGITSWTPIGKFEKTSDGDKDDKNDGSKAYKGTFDGKGHTIDNLVQGVTSYNNQGLFGVVNGGCNIRNLILGSGCKFYGGKYVGAFVGSSRGSGWVTIENCGNEANVGSNEHRPSQNAAAFIGVVVGGGPATKILNCYNTGTIKGSSSNDNAILTGWFGGHGSVEVKNFYNIGSVEGYESGKPLYRNGSTSITFTNNYSTTSDQGATQIVDSWKASGELCYLLKGTQQTNAFTQAIGTDAYPTFGSATVDRGQWFSDDYIYYNIDESGNITVNELNLDDTKTTYNVPAKVTAKSVTLTRTLHELTADGSAPRWNTFCSPVAIEKSNFSAAKELTDVTVNGDNYSMTFTNVAGDVLEAGKPYMVQVSESKSSLTASNVAVAEAVTPVTINGLKFTGNFTNGKAPMESFIISNNVFYNVDSDVTLKAFRGYITTASGTYVKALTFDFDDDATGIEETLSNSPLKGENIFNLAGQRIQKMQKGINIVNGRKVLF